MKKYFIFTLFLSLSMCALRAQDNIYASLNFTNPPSPTEYINSSAYAPSKIDFMGEGFSYISAHTTFDRNSFPNIVLKLVSPNLKLYLENGTDPYHTIELYMLSPGSTATVNDVVEAVHYNQEIAFCGSIDNRAYIGVVDQHLQAIPGKDIQVYNFEELFSIVEVPGIGYLACGKTGDKGMIMAIDYNLQPIINYEYPVILTQVIFDRPNQLVIFCGIDRFTSELSIYHIPLNDLFSGNSAVGFTCDPTGANSYMLLAGDGLRNVRMSMFENGHVAISASGDIYIPGGNTSSMGYSGILHVNALDGQNPITNVVFNWNSDKIHFRDIQTSVKDEMLYLLFYHNGSLNGEPHNPVLIEANIFHPASWFGIKIDANPTGVTRDYTRMFKRAQCHRLGLGGFENQYGTPMNSRNHYADIQTLLLNNGWPFEIPITNFVFDFPQPVINPAPGFTGMNMFWSIFTYPVTPADPPVINMPMVLLHNTFDQAQCPPSFQSPSPRSQEIEEANIVVESSAEIRFYEDRAEFSDISGYTQYAVYDMMGRKILDSKLSDNTISFSSMSKGMYILRLLKADGDFEQHKFIVK